MTEIIVAIITGGLALVGVVVSNLSTTSRITAELKTSQAVTETKIDELTREVRKHNNFAERIPVIEEQIKAANRRIDDLEEKR